MQNTNNKNSICLSQFVSSMNMFGTKALTLRGTCWGYNLYCGALLFTTNSHSQLCIFNRICNLLQCCRRLSHIGEQPESIILFHCSQPLKTCILRTAQCVCVCHGCGRNYKIYQNILFLLSLWATQDGFLCCYFIICSHRCTRFQSTDSESSVK